MVQLRILLPQILTLITIFSTVVPSFAGDVPVLIWGGGDSSKSILEPVNLFQKKTQDEFRQVFMDKVGDAQFPVRVFYRDSLCKDDVTLHEKDQLKSLEELGSFQFILAVESPLLVFDTLPFYNQSLDDEVDSESNGQLVITRVTDFDTMLDKFKMMKDANPNSIGVLTGKTCNPKRLERTRRAIDAPKQNESEAILIQTKRVLLYMDKPPTIEFDDGKVMSIGKLSKNATEEGDATFGSPMTVKLEFTESNSETVPVVTRLEFNITVKNSGYYTLGKANLFRNDRLTAEMVTLTEVVWPKNFSYHCTQHTVFYNKTGNLTEKHSIRLNLINMQIELDARKKFSDAYDCVGFTTISIWAGIFVTSILAIIMIWGLTMIMDIRTMDRFDDPKGKTITISSTD